MAALGAILQNLEQQYGLPQGYLAKTRAVESTNGTNLRNPTSSAKGDFQFIDSTAKKVGLTNPMDPIASANAAAKLASGNAQQFTAATGQAPTGADLYGMHQQGGTGYLKLLSGQRTSDAAMNGNGGAGLTGSQMVAKIHGLYNKAQPANLGEGFTFQQPAASPGANTGQGPTVANAAATPATPATPAAPAAPDPAQAKYTGGLFGLAQGADYSGAGSGKDMMGKLGDLFGKGEGGGPSPVAGAVAGLTQALGGQTTKAAPVQPMQLQDQSNAPNMQYLQMLMQRRGMA